ncbi:hypothetical protein [Hyalangium versicolor]|uniref:hypothetical protein n=1 Tax=Hyalangium versicolor TaxID=2861190 RepID=UPI001CCB5DD5|nr:hypothetical protein [Hyalangium versicolor]
MKRVVVAALAAVVWLVGCGGGGSLPTGQNSPNPQLPETPVDPNAPGKPDADPSLWPLTQGSTWTYRITEEGKGVFDKRVEVIGPQTVPGTTTPATAVRSIQPTLEELSWQVELQSGVVVRLREDDLKSGQVARSTTWAPATVKSLAKVQNQGWSYSSSIHEKVQQADGTVDEKDRTYVWRVVAVNETVVVPAGTFTNAIKVQRDRPDKEGKERIYWLVPGVGKVKEEGERLEELSSYDVKK